MLFLCVPLFYPLLDYVVPLNETRPKAPLFKLNYLVNTDDYFYTVYFHIALCCLITVLIVTTIDSLYIVIIHYTCGLFAVCGHQVKKAAEIEGRNSHSRGRNQDLLKRCVITHYKAIRFHEYMEESTRMSYLFEVCLNMIGMTVTAVQTVMYFDKPEEAFRIVMFLLGQQFHLYIISLPGQMLIDQSLQLVNDIYFSKWYQMPVQFERTLHIMLIRCSRPCKLTAGGLYEMNIENFGSIVKTSMSYFTVLLSFRE
ncbi:odorant receptor 9a-like [Megachile rotundata]|uniref:odorant receptor 9a-like n=1 Tax=Megachile rotundata TaxID=143995 RepID=UPI003FD5408B